MNKYQGTVVERRWLLSAVALACTAALLHVIVCALEHWIVCRPERVPGHNVTQSSTVRAYLFLFLLNEAAHSLISQFLLKFHQISL